MAIFPLLYNISLQFACFFIYFLLEYHCWCCCVRYCLLEAACPDTLFQTVISLPWFPLGYFSFCFFSSDSSILFRLIIYYVYCFVSVFFTWHKSHYDQNFFFSFWWFISQALRLEWMIKLKSELGISHIKCLECHSS